MTTSPLALPIDQDDVHPDEAPTVGAYLAKLLSTLLDEEEGFSGKRPLGNSDWTGYLDEALNVANAARNPETTPAITWGDLHSAIRAALTGSAAAPAADPHTLGPRFIPAGVADNAPGTERSSARYLVLHRIGDRNEYGEYGQFRNSASAIAAAAALNEVTA